MRALFAIDLTKINGLQGATVTRTLDKAERAHDIDIIIRKDGVETRFEADWLKHLNLWIIDGLGDDVNNPVALALIKGAKP